MKKITPTISRRTFLAGSANILVAPMVIKASRAAAASNSITFTAYGGSFQEALEKAALKPFTEETGIKINIVPVPDLAKVKAQMLTGNVAWDVFDAGGPTLRSGSKQGFWEQLDPSMFDLENMSVPPAADSVTYAFFAGGIAWDPKKYGPGKHPTNFAEYFDLKKFPGRRVLPNSAEETLEAALLADGVAPKDIYPLDADRAFKALDRIKPSIASWASTSTQRLALLQTGEVDFSYTYANRIKATNQPGGGTPVAFSFEQNLLGSEGLAVLKGAPNKENAMKLVAYFLRPEVQARISDASGFAPVSKKAAPMISAEARKWQPDITNANHLVINDAYWADNLEELSQRFKEWVLS
ncbi:ABC transporter substrate-binding protein [Mesorhizobium sp. M0500]|uniref:ABC transporter substrate-binding protein n=1 Tax=Mesorhizobium sp. M0500 TaxID=2956953 RepID=UPI0033397B2D